MRRVSALPWAGKDHRQTAVVLATTPTTVTSYAAIILSVGALGVTLYTYWRRKNDDAYVYLANLWNSVLDSALQYPRFFNSNVTSHYDRRMSEDERVGYDAFCYKSWGFIDDIVVKGFHEDLQFSSIIRWTAAYHLRWIQLNPQFFTDEAFWKLIDAVEDGPQLLMQYHPLPVGDDDIDWDVVSRDYHRYILGPFAPEMVNADGAGLVRNQLLTDLVDGGRFGSLAGIDMADFGCGPGNLIEHLPPDIGRLVGVDKSNAALQLASAAAARHRVRFEARRQDLCALQMEDQFDVIVCVNAILPSTRAEVIMMLESIRASLRPDGRLLTILPSYDTTQYSRDLWRQYYTEHVSPRHAARVIRALIESKRADDESSSYAEDGSTSQCYHTPETIRHEFGQAGLVIETLSKIYYPWPLVRRFDYGYFPDAPEEIWDWYVVAGRPT